MRRILAVSLLALSGCETIAVGPDVGHASSIYQHVHCGVGNQCWGFEEAGIAIKGTAGPVELRITDDYVPSYKYDVFEAHVTYWITVK